MIIVYGTTTFIATDRLQAIKILQGGLNFENANYGKIVGSVDVKCATEVDVTRARANDL